LTRRRAGNESNGFVLGASLGLVFVPCAGPVFAAVSAIANDHRVGAATVAVTIAYALGAAVPLLLIARGGQAVARRFRAHAQPLRIGAAVVMAVAAVAVYEGWETSLQTKVPAWASSLQNWIEGNGYARRQLRSLDGRPQRGNSVGSLAAKPLNVPSRAVTALNDYGPAPDFREIDHWLNTRGERPLTLSGLRGKVVLVDFWTYSCINCLRTLPYLKGWDARYRSKGLVIVGVHTPEFAFEHDLGNVRSAVARYGVRYPVALDNADGTWNAYGNQYWPADYLLDRDGHVRHVHFGEGDYAETERDIRLLLRTGRAESLPAAGADAERAPTPNQTPETYLGYFRIARYAGSPISANVREGYTFPRELPQDAFAYAGSWTIERERAVAGTGARLRLRFHAKDVHLVLGGRGRVVVSVDGHVRGAVTVRGDRLYTLVRGRKARTGLLELAFTPRVSAYAFTFG
jgi:thiol-disulfide isomerase/thioredoxin